MHSDGFIFDLSDTSCAFAKKRPALSRRPSPLLPWGPYKNLHVVAGGSPLRCFSASNIQERSNAASGGLQFTPEALGVPYDRCGF